MRLAVLLLAGFLPGCQLVFSLAEGEPIDAPHLATGQQIGTVDLAFVDGDVIDTSELVGPDGLQLERQAQVVSALDVAILRGDAVTFEGTVTITGVRPLVILARTIVVDGVLQAAAVGVAPGPSGSRSGEVSASSGGNGTAGSLNGHGGGGGGGHGTDGAEGGGGAEPCTTPAVVPGLPGAAFGDPMLPVLVGGGAGGVGAAGDNSATCTAGHGGGGGGALQLSALERVDINLTGVVSAGGGGGLGGFRCLPDLNNSGGAGGGAGGAVYLDAPVVALVGGVFANGGGGGGGSGTQFDAPVGMPGQDGQLARIAALAGAKDGQGSAGGNGGAEGLPPESGLSGCDVEAGGGGGAVGRIVIRGERTFVGMTSPEPTVFDDR